RLVHCLVRTRTASTCGNKFGSFHLASELRTCVVLFSLHTACLCTASFAATQLRDSFLRAHILDATMPGASPTKCTLYTPGDQTASVRSPRATFLYLLVARSAESWSSSEGARKSARRPGAWGSTLFDGIVAR